MRPIRQILNAQGVRCRRGAAYRQKRKTIGKQTPISVSFMISSPNWLIKTAAVGFTVMFTTSMIVSKTTIKKCDTLKKGFDKEWEKKVIRFQVPIFSPSTKGSWILRFDDILADALELGKLKNNDFSLPDGIKDYIQKNVLTSSARSAELLVKYYIVNKPDDTDKVVLPITNIDAYFGNGNFSKKWLPKELDSVIIRDPQSNGVSRYTLHEKLIQIL